MTETGQKFSISVIYNGVTRSIDVNLKQAVQAVFQKALNKFGLQSEASNLVLWLGNEELDLSFKVEQAGIQADSRLFLRPRVVRGG